MNESYKSLGLLSILITWVALAILLYKFRGHRSLSISKHAAAYKRAYLLMAITETIALPMFYIFISKWFVPSFQLPTLFTICVGLSVIGFLLAAWIPDTKGLSSIVHGIGGYGAAMLFVPATTVLYLSPVLSSPTKLFTLIVLAYQIVSVTLFNSIEKTKEYHLYLQTGYILLFQVLIIFATYSYKV